MLRNSKDVMKAKLEDIQIIMQRFSSMIIVCWIFINDNIFCFMSIGYWQFATPIYICFSSTFVLPILFVYLLIFSTFGTAVGWSFYFCISPCFTGFLIYLCACVCLLVCALQSHSYYTNCHNLLYYYWYLIGDVESIIQPNTLTFLTVCIWMCGNLYSTM